MKHALLSHFVHDQTMLTANERTRVARILIYLDRHISSCEVCTGLNVDSEYSRVGAEFTNKELSGRQTFPDLLIHKRTVQTANVLAAEVKLRMSSRPRRGPDHKDQRKIDIMTGFDHGLPEGMFPYQVGLCISLDGENAQGWWTSGAANLFQEHDSLTARPSATICRRRDVPITGTGDHK